MYQLRTYTLATEEAANTYAQIHWRRHVKSLLKHGIQTHYVFCEKKPGTHPRVMAIVSCEGEDMTSGVSGV